MGSQFPNFWHFDLILPQDLVNYFPKKFQYFFFWKMKIGLTCFFFLQFLAWVLQNFSLTLQLRILGMERICKIWKKCDKLYATHWIIYLKLSSSSQQQYNHQSKQAKVEALVASASIEIEDLRKMAWPGLSHKARAKAWKILCGYLPGWY